MLIKSYPYFTYTDTGNAYMKLVDATIKAAKPTEKTYSLPDGKGLVLLVKPSGAKWWRFRYRFNGKAKMLSAGVYLPAEAYHTANTRPTVTLQAAREKQARYRELLAQGIDPSQDKQEQKTQKQIAASNSFESVARQWWDHWRIGKTTRHAGYVIRRLKADVFPTLSRKPVTEITGSMVIKVVQKAQSRGLKVIPKRILFCCGQIMRYAVSHDLIERDPLASIKPSDVLKASEEIHYARVEIEEVPTLLRKIEKYNGNPLTKLALQLIALTFVRTSELIGGRWEEIELDKRLWRIPAERIKMNTPHIVPLSDQAITVLGEIRKLSGGNVLLFPGERRENKSMSNNTMLKALERMGYHKKMTGHGFRRIASTELKEKGHNEKHIEFQLGHLVGNEVQRAYDSATHIEQRAKMMQDWADYLDALKTGADVLPFRVGSK